MSQGSPCRCSGTQQEKMKNWYVVVFHGNYSAFNGSRFTPSDYSAITCKVCQGCWRTKAGYVYQLPKIV